MKSVREARPSDFLELAQICSLANLDDPMDTYLYPYRHQHQTSHRDVYFDYFESCHRDPFTMTIVAVDDETKTLLGFETWIRCTEKADVKRRYHEKAGVGLQHRVSTWMLDHFSRPPFLYSASGLKGQWHEIRMHLHSSKGPDAEPDEMLTIGMVAVHPDHQRQGVGAMLMKWGMDLAADEEVPIWLTATPVGEGLYRKLGFVVHSDWQWAPAKTEQQRKTRTFKAMSWEPNSLKHPPEVISDTLQPTSDEEPV